MNDQENQTLEIKYLFLVISFSGLLGFIFLPSWNRLRSEDKVVSTQRQAEVLGYQVFEIYREASSPRGPASVESQSEESAEGRESGSIGADSWGQPYRYKILKVSRDLLKVQIWSAGPNKDFETPDKPGVAADHYSGDDVGIVLSMAPKTTDR